MIPEIDTSSVVDETESAKVTTESQMAECSTQLMRRLHINVTSSVSILALNDLHDFE